MLPCLANATSVVSGSWEVVSRATPQGRTAMNDPRLDYDQEQNRTAIRVGLIGTVALSTAVIATIGLATLSSKGGETGDCQRAERAVDATKTSRVAKPDTMLFCQERGFLQRLL